MRPFFGGYGSMGYGGRVAQMMWPYEAFPNDTITKIQRGIITVVQRNHMAAPYM